MMMALALPTTTTTSFRRRRPRRDPAVISICTIVCTCRLDDLAGYIHVCIDDRDEPAISCFFLHFCFRELDQVIW
jgi:hypothetical protein